MRTALPVAVAFLSGAILVISFFFNEETTFVGRLSQELLNWVTLLYITFLADRSGSSHAAAARAVHWRPSDFYRLRHRLLERATGAVAKSMFDAEGSQFDLVFLAFLKRCGVSVSRGRQILERVG